MVSFNHHNHPERCCLLHFTDELTEVRDEWFAQDHTTKWLNIKVWMPPGPVCCPSGDWKRTSVVEALILCVAHEPWIVCPSTHTCAVICVWECERAQPQSTPSLNTAFPNPGPQRSKPPLPTSGGMSINFGTSWHQKPSQKKIPDSRERGGKEVQSGNRKCSRPEVKNLSLSPALPHTRYLKINPGIFLKPFSGFSSAQWELQCLPQSFAEKIQWNNTSAIRGKLSPEVSFVPSRDFFETSSKCLINQILFLHQCAWSSLSSSAFISHGLSLGRNPQHYGFASPRIWQTGSSFHKRFQMLRLENQRYQEHLCIIWCLASLLFG